MPFPRRAHLALAFVSLSLGRCSADPGRDVDLGHQSQPFRTGWHGDGHAEITQDGLSFVRAEVRESLANANEDVDGPVACDEANRGDLFLPPCNATKLVSAYHVDNCRVAEAFESLRTRYRKLVEVLGDDAPDFGRATKLFGSILHTAQDFHAHSNWVDTGAAEPVAANGFYHPVLEPGARLGALVVAADPLPPGYRVRRDSDSRVPEVWDGTSWQPGWISGTYADNQDSSLCPSAASIPHGDFNIRRWEDEGEYLAKDDPDSVRHGDAVALAAEQTHEEFCRLARLVALAHGAPALDRLREAWLQHPADYPRICPADAGLVASLLMVAVR